MQNFRTDLAVETREMYKAANKLEDEIPGIETQEETDEGIVVTRVKVSTEEGEKAINKPIGNYITIDVKNFKYADEDLKEKVSQKIGNELKPIINNLIGDQGDILVVGLGNLNITPDSLGPKVIGDIDVTRHILRYAPQYIEEDARPVSAIAPGVLGTTGIETVEIIKGVVEKIKPKAIIAIDALASRKLERISSTIQIADTGIHPGAGVGNNRKELSKETLGVPVIAIGIPTVVEVAVIANDALDLFIEKVQKEAKSNDYLNQLKEQDKYEEIKEALLPNDYNFIVTPKEIDELIENMTYVVAKGINVSL